MRRRSGRAVWAWRVAAKFRRSPDHLGVVAHEPGRAKRRRVAGASGLGAEGGADGGEGDVLALAGEEKTHVGVADGFEEIDGLGEAVGDALGAVGIGADDNGDAPGLHEGEHGGAGVHLGVSFVEAAGIEFHGDAGGGDAVEGALDGGLDAGEVPVCGGLVFHEVGVGEGVEEAGLGGLGEVVEICLLVAVVVAVEVFLAVVPHLHVDGAEHVVEGGAVVEALEPAFDAGVIVAFEAGEHVEATGVGGAGIGDDLEVGVELGRGHAHVGRGAVGQGAVAGDDEAFEAAAQGDGGVVDGEPVSVFTQRGVAVGLVKERIGHRRRIGRAGGRLNKMRSARVSGGDGKRERRMAAPLARND